MNKKFEAISELLNGGHDKLSAHPPEVQKILIRDIAYWGSESLAVVHKDLCTKEGTIKSHFGTLRSVYHKLKELIDEEEKLFSSDSRCGFED